MTKMNTNSWPMEGTKAPLLSYTCLDCTIYHHVELYRIFLLSLLNFIYVWDCWKSMKIKVIYFHLIDRVRKISEWGLVIESKILEQIFYSHIEGYKIDYLFFKIKVKLMNEKLMLKYVESLQILWRRLDLLWMYLHMQTFHIGRDMRIGSVGTTQFCRVAKTSTSPSPPLHTTAAAARSDRRVGPTQSPISNDHV